MIEFMHECIYLLGEMIRNPSLKKHRKELCKTDFLDIKSLEQLQLKRLKNLLKHTKKYAPFYKQEVEGIDIDSMNLEDLKKFPILRKQVLLNNMSSIQNYPKNEKMFMSATSASTGDALKFERNQNWDAATRAAQMRGFSWYGVKPWMKNLYFWGYNPKPWLKFKIRFLDFLMNRYRLFSYDEETLEKAAKYLKNCKYVEGYSSSIFTLSQYLERNNMTFPQVKMVKGTSEKIYDYYQETTNKVFDKNIISEYGAAESGLIAFECPEGSMHIVMENIIVEEVEDKIVLTNLFSHSAPMIRYELGDYIKLDTTTRCKCGREHHIIKEVTGRLGFQVQGYKNIYPTLSIYYIFKNVALNNNLTIGYFGTQHEKGKLHFKIMYDGDKQKDVISYIKLQTDEFYGDDIEIEIEFVSGIEHRNKKSHAFESFIDK